MSPNQFTGVAKLPKGVVVISSAVMLTYPVERVRGTFRETSDVAKYITRNIAVK